MAPLDPQNLSEQELKSLEVRVEELIRACAHLKNENNSLRAKQETLLAERKALELKTETAKTRVEAMINRLKALENES